MNYTLRLNKNDATKEAFESFSISTNYLDNQIEFRQTLRIIAFIDSDKANEYCNNYDSKITYLEIFDENNNIIYESDYWNTEYTMYINYNIELKTLELQRVFIHVD